MVLATDLEGTGSICSALPGLSPDHSPLCNRQSLACVHLPVFTGIFFATLGVRPKRPLHAALAERIMGLCSVPRSFDWIVERKKSLALSERRLSLCLFLGSKGKHRGAGGRYALIFNGYSGFSLGGENGKFLNTSSPSREMRYSSQGIGLDSACPCSRSQELKLLRCCFALIPAALSTLLQYIASIFTAFTLFLQSMRVDISTVARFPLNEINGIILQ